MNHLIWMNISIIVLGVTNILQAIWLNRLNKQIETIMVHIIIKGSRRDE